MISTILESIFGVLGWIVTKIVEFAREWADAVLEYTRWLWEWFVWLLGKLWDELWPHIHDMLPPEFQQRLNDLPISAARAVWQDVAWILPIEEVLGIVFTTYAVVATIRLVRWCLALVPTIGG